VVDQLHEETHSATNNGTPPPEMGEPQQLNLLDTLQQELKFQAQHRPYMTLTAAFAVGYVLGGGVPWWAVRAATSIGGRALVARAVASIVEEP
jgi:hypothetical protein